MSSFLIRVELIVESRTSYGKLIRDLSRIGFYKTIITRTGEECKLPNGNFIGEREESLRVVTQTVVRLIKNIDIGAAILVTEIKEDAIECHGLDVAQKPVRWAFLTKPFSKHLYVKTR